MGDTPITYEKLQQMAENPDKVHIVVQADRLGSRLFCVKLEYENYPPRTEKNKLFDLTLVRWPSDDFQLVWFVVSIPKDDFYIAETVAESSGLKIKDGIPIMIGGGEDQFFPMNSPTVFSLESNTKSKVYNNNPKEITNLKTAEYAECDRIISEDKKRLHADLIAEGRTEAEIKQLFKQWEGE